MTTYPNVPNDPGVPPVLRDPNAPPATPTPLVAADGSSVPTGNNPPQWGILKDGVFVIAADNVVSFEYQQAWNISTYPVEDGGFASYDKVNNPFDARLRFSCGGSLFARTRFIQSIEAIAGDLNLYDVIIPERVYTNVNISKYGYGRTATNGAGLIQVDIGLLEIRSTATEVFRDTASPSGADPVNGGTVQPVQHVVSGPFGTAVPSLF